MQKKIISAIITVAMVLPAFGAVYAEDGLPEMGEVISGFKVIETGEEKLFNSKTVLFEHEKTGGKLLFISNDDTERAFDIAFRTPSYDTGISHVFEHISLGGSEKYPENIFFNVANQTLNSYMNAYTMQECTYYPLSSISDDQLLKLADYYLDGVFHPLIESGEAFRREGWRYELDSPESVLNLNGTVYSEMKGAMGGDAQSYYNTIKTVFPGSNRAAVSGGEPEIIPQMTNEDIIEYHAEYYRPSNAFAVLYGKADYKKYLELLDEYFSDYDDTPADLSDSGYKPISGHVEKTFAITGTEGGSSYMYYAIPCTGADTDDVFGLSFAASLLSMDSSDFMQSMKEEYPSSSVGAGVEINLTEPLLLIYADNINEGDAVRFKSTADKALRETAEKGFYDEQIDAFAANLKRDTLTMPENTGNVGISLISNLNVMWTATESEAGYFDYIDYAEHLESTAEKGELEELISKYLIEPESSAVTINIPDENLAAERDERLKKHLAEVKASMTDEEINEIVNKTAEYRRGSTVSENGLLNKINVSSPEALKDELENYREKTYPFETESVGDARILTSEADIGEIGLARLYLDISQLDEEQLLYFELYENMMGMLPTEKYTQQEIYGKLARYISGSSKLLPADDTLYYTFSWVPLDEDTEAVYDVLYEMLFTSKTDDIEMISPLVDRIISSMEQSFVSAPDNLVIARLRAQANKKAAYYSYMEGLDYYNFLKAVRDELAVNPESVLEKLSEVKETVANSYNASLIFAGNKNGIELNKKFGGEFLKRLKNTAHGGAEHNIPVPCGDEAFIMPTDVNYNGVFAPLEEIGADRSGQMLVTQSIVNDRFIIPQLRDVQGAYGCSLALNEYGMGMVSYRDPQLKATYDFYNTLPELIENADITRSDVDGYILSVFSSNAVKHGSLMSAYESMRKSVYSTERDRYELLSEILDTTADDVRAYGKVYAALAEKGIISSAGIKTDITENSAMFDKITDPFAAAEDIIKIIIDGKEIQTDVLPVIKNDRILIPLRAVSENLGCNVEWDGTEQRVTVSTDSVTAEFIIGNDVMSVNGKEITLDAAPEIVNDRTLVPLRAAAEAIGCDVNWDESARCALIESR